MTVLRALLGLLFFCFVAWLMSSDRRALPWRVVLCGILLQVALAAFILETTIGSEVFQTMSGFVTTLISKAQPGADLVFGPLADAQGPFGMVFTFAGNGLPVIIFFSALMGVLYTWASCR